MSVKCVYCGDDILDESDIEEIQQLKQQLESCQSELSGISGQLKEAVEVIEELNDIVVGHIEEGDKLDSFTFQPAKQFLTKYHSVNANEMVAKYRGEK